MPPTSYQSPNVGDQEKDKTVSQSAETNLSSTKSSVADLLEKKGNGVISVRPDQTIEDVVLILRDKRIGAVVVTNSDDQILGILSERDIVRKMAETPGQTLPQKVQDLMTKSVVTCTPADPLISVLQRMTEGRFRHMPVIDENANLHGIVTIGDVVHFRLNELEYEALQMKQMIVG